MIGMLDSYLAKWRTKALSYYGRLQLANWVLYGKFSYWLNGTLLPRKTLRKVKSIIYAFIWDGRKGISWSLMAKSKAEGGLGLRDLRLLDAATMIKK